MNNILEDCEITEVDLYLTNGTSQTSGGLQWTIDGYVSIHSNPNVADSSFEGIHVVQRFHS
jgi:hypothetical protein